MNTTDAVPIPDAGGSRPILAALSLDAQGQQCLLQACRQATLTGAAIIALHVIHETGRNAGLYRRHDTGEVLRPVAEIARGLLADVSAELLGNEPECQDQQPQLLAVEGLPEQRIPEVAERVGAGLIIVGGRRPRGLDRLFGRNVARHVLLKARCPVLVVDIDGNYIDPHDLLPGHRNGYRGVLQTR
jgi:nucleotide-binding universal stress UspA family protein